MDAQAKSVDGSSNGTVAAIGFGIGAPITAIGGAGIAHGIANGDPGIVLGGVGLLALGGANLALAVLNGIEAVARKTTSLLRVERGINSLRGDDSQIREWFRK